MVPCFPPKNNGLLFIVHSVVLVSSCSQNFSPQSNVLFHHFQPSFSGFIIIFNRVSQGLSSFSTGFLRVYHGFQPGFNRVYHGFQPGFSGFIIIFNRVSTGFIIIFNRVSQGLSSFSTGFLRVYQGLSWFSPFFTYLNDLSSGHFFLFFLVIGSPRSVLAKVEPWDEVMAGASEILNHAEGALGSAGSRWAQVM